VFKPSTELVKTVEAPTPLLPDSLIVFSVKVTNVGQADYTAERPLVVTDSLIEVLDDAQYLGDAVPSAGTVEFVSPRLVWVLPLVMGDSALLTYGVKVLTAGDASISNFAWTVDSVDSAWAAEPPDDQLCGQACSAVWLEKVFPLPPTGVKDLPMAILVGIWAFTGGWLLLVWSRRRERARRQVRVRT
jgi:LPXTG-motif cell wall-anchored protein